MPEDFDPFAKFEPQTMETSADALDFDQFLSSVKDAGFNYDEGGSDDDNVGDPEPPETPENDQPTPPSVDSVRIGERDVPLSEVRLLYEFGKTIRENGLDSGGAATATPEPTQIVPPVESSGQTTTPPPEEPPSYIDQDDDVQMGLWKELQATRREIAETRQQVNQTVGQIRMTQQQQEVSTGIDQFKAEHPNLNEDEMTMLITLATPTADHFVRTAKSPVEGIKKALYIAGLDFEPTRERILSIEPSTPKKKTSTQRKRALGSLAGSSGSAPRTPSRPRPTTDKEAVSDFATELAQAFGSNGSLN